MAAGGRYAAPMPNVGPMELIVILAIALIVLGPKKLPEVGRSIGKGMREFKDSVTGKDDEDTEEPRALDRPQGEREQPVDGEIVRERR